MDGAGLRDWYRKLKEMSQDVDANEKKIIKRKAKISKLTSEYLHKVMSLPGLDQQLNLNDIAAYGHSIMKQNLKFAKYIEKNAEFKQSFNNKAAEFDMQFEILQITDKDDVYCLEKLTRRVPGTEFFVGTRDRLMACFVKSCHLSSAKCLKWPMASVPEFYLLCSGLRTINIHREKLIKMNETFSILLDDFRSYTTGNKGKISFLVEVFNLFLISSL